MKEETEDIIIAGCGMFIAGILCGLLVGFFFGLCLIN